MSEQQQAAEVATEEQKTEDQFAEADARGAVDEQEAPSIEDLASEQGWMPKEKFKGPEGDWKPAHEFLRAGKDIQRNLSRELKDVRSTLDTVAKTSAAVLQERLAEQRADLTREYQKAVDSGDHDAAWQAANGIIKIDSTAQNVGATRPAPPAEAVEWSQRNQRVAKDPAAMQRAVELCEPYAKANWPAGQQLAAIEPKLRMEFPHLFDANDGKPPPGGSGFTGSRMNGTQKRGQTAADLPKEAREIAKDMVDRGLIKTEDDYARNYFAMQAKGK